MSRRRGVILGVLLVLAGAVGAGCWLLLSDPINPWAEGRLRVGMTEPEVLAILGRPADRAYHPWHVAVFMPPAPDTSPEWEKAWVGQEWVILVHFDEVGKVLKVGCGDKDFDNPPPRTVSRQLWRLLGW
jgi:hypothetical protein